MRPTLINRLRITLLPWTWNDDLECYVRKNLLGKHVASGPKYLDEMALADKLLVEQDYILA